MGLVEVTNVHGNDLNRIMRIVIPFDRPFRSLKKTY